jgi:hypothetical protein
VELVTIIVVLLVCVVFIGMAGVVAASIAYVIGKCASTLYLVPRQTKVIREWRSKYAD